MSLIRPFAALRPAAGYADAVIAPPYDVVNSEEARILVQGRPWSFLHVSKPEIDHPNGMNPYDSEIYSTGITNFKRMIENGILMQDKRPGYYVYRLIMDERVQIGIAVTISIAAYQENRICRHEYTRPDKEDDRVKHIQALNAQTGPVLLAYPDLYGIDSILNAIINQEPDVDVFSDIGVRHTLWCVYEGMAIKKLTEFFDKIPKLYIADGHHRSAAASRVSLSRSSNHQERFLLSDYFLAVLFPCHQMYIMEYNRLIKDLNGLMIPDFFKQVEKSFVIEEVFSSYKPRAPGEFGLYLDHKWYKLRIKSELVSSDPVERLDVSLLHDYLITPILGIEDVRRDRRIDFVGGIRGIVELERRVDSGEMVLAFSLFPTRMSDLMAVADMGKVMPPKSTWFEPKLADGLVSYLL